jgi:4-carboxymuconolactone decarboxylase
MNVPNKTDNVDDTREILARLALGDPDALRLGAEWQEGVGERSNLDPRSIALVRIAALVAVGSPPASYAWQVNAAIDVGVTPQEILGMLLTIAPEVGSPKVISAAPEIMLALGLPLPDEVARLTPAASRTPPGTDFDEDDEDDEDDSES